MTLSELTNRPQVWLPMPTASSSPDSLVLEEWATVTRGRAVRVTLCAPISERSNSIQTIRNCKASWRRLALTHRSLIEPRDFSMKRCPKCNRTFTTDTQKFCTHDGGLLLDAGQETVRIESGALDAPTKVISRDLMSQVTGEIDPFKTIVTRPEATGGASSKVTDDLSRQTVPPPAPQPTPKPPPAASSGPIAPPPPAPPISPPASTPAPATPPPGSGPIAPSTPPRFAPSSQAQQVQPLRSAPPRGKSKLPIVLGILAVLFIVGVVAIAAAYVFVVRPRVIARRITAHPTPLLRPVDDQPTPLASVTPNNSDTSSATPEGPPEYRPPPNAVEFVNSKDNLDGKLAEHYVDFSFYYPNNWEKDPKAGVAGASNFAKVERRLPPDFTQENFAVGSYVSAGSEEGDRAVFHSLAENLSAQFAKGFTDYKKVSEGPTKAGPYDGYGFRFQSSSRNTERGDITIWGRVIFLPPVDGGKNGATLLML